jgi:hypothetical protein
MKYVYVLVSSDNDLYYEQALMSATSLRFYMPGAEVIVLTDNRTAETLKDNKRSALSDYSEIVTVPFADDISNVERSRLIKTAIPDYVSGSFLYIDCDTVIADDLSSVADFPYEAAGVLDGHVLLDEHIHKRTFIERDKILGFHGTESGYNINGGVLLAKDTPYMHTLFTEWNKAWKYSAYKKHDFHDQSALNQADYATGFKIRQLPGEWNCQPEHGGLAFLNNAKIIHYYSSEIAGNNYIPYYKLADKNIQLRIKQTGSIPSDILSMLHNPKMQFNKVHLISDRRIVSVMQSPLLFTLADLKSRCPAAFSFLEVQASFIRKIGKKLKGH